MKRAAVYVGICGLMIVVVVCAAVIATAGAVADELGGRV